MADIDDDELLDALGVEVAPLKTSSRTPREERIIAGFEDILQQLFAAYGLTMSFEQYVLVGSTVRSYLAWLKDTGRLTALFEDGWMRWVRV